MEDREFAFTDRDFRTLVTLVKERAGITLADHKKNMVYSRLARRLRELKLKSFSDYIEFLTSPEGEVETGNFVNAITTNLTSFFRESHHFDILGEFLKQHAQKHMRGSRRLRIWSAGCSAGPEPYSIAMTVMHHLPGYAQWDVKILATDIDTNMLDTASAGMYKMDMYDGIPPAYKSEHTRTITDGREKKFVINDDVKKLISFKRLNLLERWPMKGPFDVIFCRNVVIYFDKDTQRTLFNRYADMLTPQGYLFIGHSENLSAVSNRFKLLGKTVYQKVA